MTRTWKPLPLLLAISCAAAGLLAKASAAPPFTLEAVTDFIDELSAAKTAAAKAGKKGAFNTEFGRRDTQPYCKAFAAAVADAGWRVDELPVAFDRGRLLREAPEVKEE